LGSSEAQNFRTKSENWQRSYFNPRLARRFRRTTMFRKFAFALATAASLGALALAPSSASAHGFGGFGPHLGGGGFGHHLGGGGFGHHLHGGGFGLVGVPVAADSGCFVTRPVLTPFGYRMRTVDVCD
jgi:hypothetical protein